MFYHALSGCDTIISLIPKRKKILQILDKQKDINSIVSIFNNPNLSHEEIAKNGVKCFLYLYGVSKNEKSLNQQRYKLFTKNVTKTKFESLPPIEETVRQHSYRVYLQVQL